MLLQYKQFWFIYFSLDIWLIWQNWLNMWLWHLGWLNITNTDVPCILKLLKWHVAIMFEKIWSISSLCIIACFVFSLLGWQKVRYKCTFWTKRVLLLQWVLKRKFKGAVMSGEEIIKSVRFHGKQHCNSSNSTCTEFRVQLLVWVFRESQRQPQNH